MAPLYIFFVWLAWLLFADSGPPHRPAKPAAAPPPERKPSEEFDGTQVCARRRCDPASRRPLPRGWRRGA
jgi:hypothetical protein